MIREVRRGPLGQIRGTDAQDGRAGRTRSRPHRKHSREPENCPICIEPIDPSAVKRKHSGGPDSRAQAVTLPCQGEHTFHRHCITDWLGTKLNCPVCNDSFVAPGLYTYGWEERQKKLLGTLGVDVLSGRRRWTLDQIRDNRGNRVDYVPWWSVSWRIVVIRKH